MISKISLITSHRQFHYCLNNKIDKFFSLSKWNSEYNILPWFSLLSLAKNLSFFPRCSNFTFPSSSSKKNSLEYSNQSSSLTKDGMVTRFVCNYSGIVCPATNNRTTCRGHVLITTRRFQRLLSPFSSHFFPPWSSFSQSEKCIEMRNRSEGTWVEIEFN